MVDLSDRLKRYSKKALADALDPDFADAVYEAADEIEDMTYDIDCFNDEITAMFGTNQALLDFAHFVAEEVVVDGDEWAYEQFSFPELACRRLYKLGIIEEEDCKWKYEPKIITVGGEGNGSEYIDRQEAIETVAFYLEDPDGVDHALQSIKDIPPADVLPIPGGGIGEVSDGYHTFNGLYYQRMVLFAALVKQNKDKAWKSLRHEDGELCFGGGWFIVGIDTPDGSYTYHYEDNFWSMFDCEELPVARHWDGHTEKDVTRLLSLPDVQPVKHSRWKLDGEPPWYVRECPECYEKWFHWSGFSMPNYCPNCGARMDGDNNG